MSRDRRDALLDKDWADAWETLPEAPKLVDRPKTAQITLRVPTSVLSRVRRVAHVRGLPYHALARSWILEGLRTPGTAQTSTRLDEPQSEQLNVKLDQDVLDQLKARADELRRPYHRMAREWIEASLGQEEKNLGLDSEPASQPAIKDLIVLLLHAANKRGDDTVRGITRLQKLMFVIEQKLANQTRFYAFNYGPFSEEVNDAAQALRLAGFLRGSTPATTDPPSFAEMMATVTERSGPRSGDSDSEEFALSSEGHEAAERLRRSSRAYDQLYAYVRAVREEWDTPDLVARVYKTYPKFTEKSFIREELARRGVKRRLS
jgi:predicted DNA binding CopG/RHH family protein